MFKLPVLKPDETIAALEKAGFHQVRKCGSHTQLKRGNLLVTIPIQTSVGTPVPLNPQVLRSILRQAHMTINGDPTLLD